MTYNISYNAKLIDIEEYQIKGFEELFGYLSGLCAGNYDITDIFVDGLFKICERDYDAAGAFFKRVSELSRQCSSNITFTVSVKKEELPESVLQYV